MNLENFTEQATYCLQKAHEFASSLAHQRLLPEHLLSQLLKEPNDLPSRIIDLAKGDRNKLEILLAKSLDTVPKVLDQNQVLLDQSFQDLLSEAKKLAKERNDKFIAIDILLLALSSSKSKATWS